MIKKCIQFNARLQGGTAALVIGLAAASTPPAAAQTPEPPMAKVEVSGQVATVNGTPAPAEYVSIHVDGGEMRQVINSFAMQANRNIVLGPEVTNDTVTIHLNNVQWENALDVILKPYGYGFRQVGDATVVGELTRLKALETVEPLQSRIYNLNYLDASDVDGIIKGMLSPRGSHSIITAKGQKGWKDLAQKSRRSVGSGSSLEMRTRDEEQVYSKTIVVSDVPAVLDNVTDTLDSIDRVPQQILVEARFMEVNENVLKDIGAQFGIGWMNSAGNGLGINNRVFDNEPGVFDAMSTTLSGAGSAEDPILYGGPTSMGNTEQAANMLDTGGQFFGVGSVDNVSMEMYINLLEEDEDTQTLSAPKVLTLNNQEAAIVVGTRYPIIKSEYNTSSSSSTSEVQSETLEYYESIGIQLNVVPQICADNYIKMVVRPSVTEVVGFSGENDYPIIKTRDTETQVLAANGQTIVIGGLLEERESTGVFKVPYLGDIPYLGRLFRRDTTDNKTIDLLIFISATVVDENNYDLIVKAPEAPEESVIIEMTQTEPDLNGDLMEENLSMAAARPGIEPAMSDLMSELATE
jgi:type IV pilus secretin PilQ/predicted competence protein